MSGKIDSGICNNLLTDFKSFKPLPVSNTTLLEFASMLFDLTNDRNPANAVVAAGSENIPVFFDKITEA